MTMLPGISIVSEQRPRKVSSPNEPIEDESLETFDHLSDSSDSEDFPTDQGFPLTEIQELFSKSNTIVANLWYYSIDPFHVVAIHE